MLALINARSFQVAKIQTPPQELEGPIVTCVSQYPSYPQTLEKNNFICSLSRGVSSVSMEERLPLGGRSRRVQRALNHQYSQ